MEGSAVNGALCDSLKLIFRVSLPNEITLAIAELLPLSTRALLALCNHQLFNLLSPQVFLDLRSEQRFESADIYAGKRRQTSLFLTQLSKDLPQYYADGQFQKLRWNDKVKSPSTWPNTMIPNFKWPQIRCMGSPYRFGCSAWQHRRGSPHFIKRAQIQLALERQNFGPAHGIPVENFSDVLMEAQGQYRRLRLCSLDAAISSDELLVCSQHWIIIPSDQLETFITYPHALELCQDLRVSFEESLDTLARCASSHTVDEERCKFCEKGTRCTECGMEVNFNIVRFAAKKQEWSAVIVTRWLSLGGSLETFSIPYLLQTWRRQMPFKATLGPEGGIRERFETANKKSLKDLTAENLERVFAWRPLGMQRIGSTKYRWRTAFPRVRPSLYYLNTDRRFKGLLEIPMIIMGLLVDLVLWR